MANLSSGDRDACVGRFVRDYFIALAKTADLDSDEIRTLVNDIDAWLDTNQAAANSAITLAIRNKASTATKFAALAVVAMKRGELF